MNLETLLDISFLDGRDFYNPYIEVLSTNYGGYNTSLLIDCTSDTIEIPIILFDYLKDTEVTEIGSCIYNVPLYSATTTSALRTATQVFMNIIGVTYKHRLRKISTPNATYYVGRGLILNSEFKPLYMLSVELSRNYNIKNANCRISPRVFECPKDLINKTIIKKVMPFYMFNKVRVQNSIESEVYKNVKIIIENFDNIFITPNEPSLEDFEESVHQCLINNIRDIVCQ